MTARERILTTLRGGIADRVPVAPFITEEYLAYLDPDRPSFDRVTDVARLARAMGFDAVGKSKRFMTPHFLLRDQPDWRVTIRTVREDDLHVTRTEIETPDLTLVQELVVPDAGAATAGLMPTYRKPLLDTPEAIEVFIRRLPPIDDATIRDMRDTVAAWSGAVGDDGILAPWGWAGVFNFAADLCGMEAVMMAPYTDEPAYRALMDALASAMAAYNEPLARAGADMIGLQGHIAGGASVSPEYFDEFVAPYEKRVIDAIHAAGAFSVYHNCGYARNLYPQYRALGMTVWETVAEPPRGDNSLAGAKRELGDAICLCGNLDQVDFLKTATPAEVAERTRQVVETGKPGGRFMFACADFIERGTPRANVEAMIAAARDAGNY